VASSNDGRPGETKALVVVGHGKRIEIARGSINSSCGLALENDAVPNYRHDSSGSRSSRHVIGVVVKKEPLVRHHHAVGLPLSAAGTHLKGNQRVGCREDVRRDDRNSLPDGVRGGAGVVVMTLLQPIRLQLDLLEQALGYENRLNPRGAAHSHVAQVRQLHRSNVLVVRESPRGASR